MEEIKEAPWFAEGLKFKCTECGKCCTGSPGYVFLSSSDLERLAEHFSVTSDIFIKTYTYKVDDRLSLIDRPGTTDCIFLKDKRCTIYYARPTQCRTFPWWLHFLKDDAAWEKAASHCEGINHPEAPIVPGLKIQGELLTYLDNLIEQNFSLPT
ncbi:MAG: YkgJ family cysteine cluster protein [Chlamydiae bacterium]|nr:YkgJ family cysteine cluster protein [Chlamydiota bacterium]